MVELSHLMVAYLTMSLSSTMLAHAMRSPPPLGAWTTMDFPVDKIPTKVLQMEGGCES